jgi:hypothetical protein
MRLRWMASILAGLVAGGIALGGAAAADLPTTKGEPVAPVAPPPPDAWRYQFTLYGWATALNGKIGIRDLPPVNANVTFADILKNLDGALMGAFTAQNETWMVLGDLVASKLSADKTFRDGFGDTLKLEQSMVIASGYLGYRLPVGSPTVDVRALAGLRYTSLNATATFFPRLLPISIERSGNQDWVDPVVGVSVHYDITDRWFINAIGDIGGFSVGSRLSAQGFLAVGYKWTQNISTSIGYRALYMDYRNNGFVYDETMHGVFVGLGIHF